MMNPCIVAELSGNHLGSLDRALALIGAAAHAGADAVKFQTYDPQMLVGDHTYTLKSGPWAGERLVDLYRRAHTPREWHGKLFARAEERGIGAFSSAFSPEDVDFLEVLSCPQYKIASCELVDLPLIRYAASTHKPVILSTGMATLDEVLAGVNAALEGGASKVTVLKCTAAYPATAGEANLATLLELRHRIWMVADSRGAVGLSDHTLGVGVAALAAGLGVEMIEKHFTFRRADGGPDAAFSAEPEEFRAMVNACREAAAAMGRLAFGPHPSEEPQLALRRSLWIVQDVGAGLPLTPQNLRSCRPAGGAPAADYQGFIGRKTALALKAGTPFSPEMVE